MKITFMKNTMLSFAFLISILSSAPSFAVNNLVCNLPITADNFKTYFPKGLTVKTSNDKSLPVNIRHVGSLSLESFVADTKKSHGFTCNVDVAGTDGKTYDFKSMVIQPITKEELAKTKKEYFQIYQEERDGLDNYFYFKTTADHKKGGPELNFLDCTFQVGENYSKSKKTPTFGDLAFALMSVESGSTATNLESKTSALTAVGLEGCKVRLTASEADADKRESSVGAGKSGIGYDGSPTKVKKDNQGTVTH